MHSARGSLDMHSLFAIIESPMTIHKAMPGDEGVRVGIASSDGTWYLRFYTDWDDDGEQLEGNYDVTLPLDSAEEVRKDIAPTLQASICEEPSGKYFARIRL